MLQALRQFFDQHIAAAAPADPEHGLRLATAALLVEVVRIDRDTQEAEREWPACCTCRTRPTSRPRCGPRRRPRRMLLDPCSRLSAGHASRPPGAG